MFFNGACGVGAGGIGLIAFSHLLAYVFRRFREGTIGLLTGFVMGSLLIIWPWKKTVFLTDETGARIVKEGGEWIEKGYQWLAPTANGETVLAVALMVVGALLVLWIGRFDAGKTSVKASMPSDQ